MPYTDPEAKRQADRAHYQANREKIKTRVRERSRLIAAGSLAPEAKDVLGQFERHVDKSGDC